MASSRCDNLTLYRISDLSQIDFPTVIENMQHAETENIQADPVWTSGLQLVRQGVSVIKATDSVTDSSYNVGLLFIWNLDGSRATHLINVFLPSSLVHISIRNRSL